MSQELHARAERLIAQERVEGISTGDRIERGVAAGAG